MADRTLDPRPFHERPAHWHYGKCGWQSRYDWDERVAMSELGIGPEEAPLNDNGRVGSVSLRGRSLPDNQLAHLKSFAQLSMVDLVDSSFTDDCIPHLLAVTTLEWVWVADSNITPSGIRLLEKQRPDMFVMRAGEGAVSAPSGGWVKITKDTWPTKKPWWRFW